MNEEPTMNHLDTVATADILASISKLQERQKRCPPTSTEWEQASESLAPLFAEMARRQNLPV